jgi:hypothetical protein
MKTTKSGSNDTPQAWVAIKRNRQKIYDGKGSTPSKIYLKDGQEFEIELYNPTPSRYLVKFKINGKYQSDRGLILNPGQRYFLDRFIDEDRKLAFQTYEVENTKTNQKATEKNGLLEVEFFSEVEVKLNTPGSWTVYNPPTYWYNKYNSGTPNYHLYSGTLNNTGSSNLVGTLTTSGSTTTTINAASGNLSNYNFTFTSNGDNAFYSSVGMESNVKSATLDSSFETGRVERGDKSDQKFQNGYGDFYAWAAYTSEVQIIPLSQKPVETQEIRSYCTGCGSRMKKTTWKFCPNCGTENN